MTRAELIQAVARKLPNINANDVDRVIDAAIDEIKIALAGGGEVVLPGLGKFSVKHCAARIGQNPRTAEDLIIPAHKRPHFTASKSFKAAVNPS